MPTITTSVVTVSVVSWLDEVHLLIHSSGMVHGGTTPRDLVYFIFLCNLDRKKNWLFIKFLVHNSLSWVFLFFFNPFLKLLLLSINTCARAWPVAWQNMLFIFLLKGNWIEDVLSLLCMLITQIFLVLVFIIFGEELQRICYKIYIHTITITAIIYYYYKKIETK